MIAEPDSMCGAVWLIFFLARSEMRRTYAHFRPGGTRVVAVVNPDRAIVAHEVPSFHSKIEHFGDGGVYPRAVVAPSGSSSTCVAVGPFCQVSR